MGTGVKKFYQVLYLALRRSYQNRCEVLFFLEGEWHASKIWPTLQQATPLVQFPKALERPQNNVGPASRVIQRVRTIKEMPSSWQCATVRLFHKKGPADNPGNFRPIALSNCDGKIFFGLINQCAQQDCIKSKFFDHRLQRGFMPGVLDA